MHKISYVKKQIKNLPQSLELVVQVYNINSGHNILKSFLETQGSEVLNMLLTEWNIEEAKEEIYTISSCPTTDFVPYF